MKQIVFYSGQSDFPNPCNRGFIHDALVSATVAITADDSIAVEPVVDRDTQGVPGSPDIASTIFAKITAADVFVARCIDRGAEPEAAHPQPECPHRSRACVQGALGHERVVLVFNKPSGRSRNCRLICG